MVDSTDHTILLVAIANNGGFVVADTAVTMDGALMQKLDNEVNGGLQDIVFYFLGPSKGLHTLLLLMQGGGSDDLMAYSVSFSNVKQVTPGTSQAMGNTTPTDVVVGSSLDHVVIDFLAAEGDAMTLKPFMGQLPLFNVGTGVGMTNVSLGASKTPGLNGQVHMSWMLGAAAPWVDVVVDLAPP